jgi:predicted kinase
MKLSQLKKIIKEEIQNVMHEGVYDPGTLKAVFLAGGPGSGKSTVGNALFGVTKAGFTMEGMKNVNSDKFFEFLLTKGGFSFDLASLSKADFEKVTQGADSPRGRAKEMFRKSYAFFLNGRLGLLIDGTADDPQKLIKQSEELKNMFGYDTCMVFVNTPLEKALERNNKRERKLPADIVEEIWTAAQAAKKEYENYFGNAFMEAINDKDSAPGQPIAIEPQVEKFARSFMRKPVQNQVGKEWIAQELANKKR